jgi:hypothetical protein
MRSVLLLCLAASASSLAFADEAPVVPFLAHRAVYDLTLERSTGDKAPSAAKGRIAYEFTGSACEGYVTNFRQVTDLQPAEGGTRLSDMRSTSFEDGAAKTFRFKIDTSTDQVPQDSIDGAATRLPNGGLSVDLTQPKTDKFELPAGIVFPTQHLQVIIAAARKGDKQLSVQAYDGSDNGHKVFDTFTVIGKAAEAPSSEPGAQADALAKTRRWPVAISYFEPGKSDGAPSYVLAFDLYENGVSGALKLDYGDFVLAGTLVKFETLPATPCPK